MRASRTRGKASFALSIQIRVFVHLCVIINNIHDQCKCSRPGRVGTSLITLSQFTTKAGSVQVRASRTRGKASIILSMHISKSEHLCIYVSLYITCMTSASAAIQDTWEQASSYSSQLTIKAGSVPVQASRTRGNASFALSIHISKSEHMRIFVLAHTKPVQVWTSKTCGNKSH